MALPTTRGQREFDKFVETTGGSVAIRTVLADASGSDLSVLEDAQHTSGDPGFQLLAVRNDTLAALAGTDGDYGSLQINAKGALYADISSVLGSDMAASNPLIAKLSDGTNVISASNPLDIQIGDGTTQASVLARTTGTEQPAVTDDALVVYDVGGGSASVTAKYRATTNGCDGTAVYASASTLTISGTPFTINSEDLVYVREVDATGNTAEIFVNGSGGVHMEISAGTLTKSGGSDFSANGAYEVGYNGQDKSYAAASNANQTAEVAPLSQNYVGETLLALTDIAANTTGYGYIDMSGYRYLTIQNETSGTTPTDTLTLTLEMTCQDDGTAAASCTYQDVTLDLTGSASYVDEDCMWIVDVPLPCKYLRIKYVTSDTGGSDADLTTYVKKMY